MIEHIMIPLDGSDTAERALTHAASLARLFGARVTLARVPDMLITPVWNGSVWATEQVDPEEVRRRAASYLQEVAARAPLAGLRIATATPDHPVAAGLLAAIDDLGVDLVVMTTHGYSGFRRWLLGSVAEKLAGAAPVPVYVVREENLPPEGAPELRTLLVPLDGSEMAEAALDTAAMLARRSGARMVLVQIPTIPAYVTSIPETAGWIPTFLRSQADEAAAYLGAKAEGLAAEGLSVDLDVEIVATGSVADGILQSARQHDADLIVMTGRGHTGLGRWLFGNVTAEVLRSTDRPVWLVRSPQ